MSETVWERSSKPLLSTVHVPGVLSCICRPGKPHRCGYKAVEGSARQVEAVERSMRSNGQFGSRANLVDNMVPGPGEGPGPAAGPPEPPEEDKPSAIYNLKRVA